MKHYIQDDWTPPERATIHWDGKLMGSLENKDINEERLPILVSGDGSIKLLYVPAIVSGIGQNIATAVQTAVQDWKCEDNILCMAFDTTSSNTGHTIGACVLLQNLLGRPLMWIPCRHHIGEVILTHVWDALEIETSKSPDILLFKRMKNHYSDIVGADLTSVKFNNSSIPSEKKQEVISFLQSIDSSSMRGDYKELLELTAYFLNGCRDDNFKFRKSKPIHKARWMGKMLFCLKLSLCEDIIIEKLPSGSIFEDSQNEKIHRFVCFIANIYITWGFSCSYRCDVTVNDVSLLQQLKSYKEVDALIASTAVKPLQRHAWYMSPEWAASAIFSNKMGVKEKREVVEKLLSVANTPILRLRDSKSTYGKPQFPSIVGEEELHVVDFINTDSWFLFRVMRLDTTFLATPVESWEDQPSYRKARRTVNNMEVVNDAAERGVRLASDYLSRTQIGEKYQNVLQVVEKDRHLLPNKRNRKGSNRETWFLRFSKHIL